MRIEKKISKIEPYWKTSNTYKARANNSLNAFKNLKNNLSRKQDPSIKFLNPLKKQEDNIRKMSKSSTTGNLKTNAFSDS